MKFGNWVSLLCCIGWLAVGAGWLWFGLTLSNITIGGAIILAAYGCLSDAFPDRK